MRGIFYSTIGAKDFIVQQNYRRIERDNPCIIFVAQHSTVWKMISLEHKEQAEVFTRFWNSYPEERQLVHANNNNSHNAAEGAKNMVLGVVAGVSDLEYIKTGTCHFIEYKTLTGTQSDKQKSFQKKIEENGFPYHLVFGKIALWNLLEGIRTGKIKGKMY